MKVLPTEKNRVLHTMDYSIFSYAEKDKFYNKRLIALVSEMEVKNISKDVPIIVDNEYNILDGVYRFKANQILKQPIYYKVSEGATMLDLMKAGTMTHKPSDYEYVLYHKDKLAYRKIIDYNKILPFPYGDIISVMETNWLEKKRREIYRRFQDGEMVFTKTDDFVLSNIGKFITLFSEKHGYRQLRIDFIKTELAVQNYNIEKVISTFESYPFFAEFISLNDNGHPNFKSFEDFLAESYSLYVEPNDEKQSMETTKTMFMGGALLSRSKVPNVDCS